MQIVSTSMTVADYCKAMDRAEIIVNKEYQRSDKVWPHSARSYLIETILIGYPVPKLSLYQVTDLKSRTTHKEIVDGQQRSGAVHDFFKDNLRLSSTLETEDVAGKTYSELDGEYQQRFIDFALSLDLFVAASTEEVREVFRRMNSYTVPLNPEEHRHALYQGLFKWFVQKIARRFGASFVTMGLFRDKQLVRMADTKLLAEISHSALNGIQTTKAPDLDKLYRAKDKEFPEEDWLDELLSGAFDQLVGWRDLHGTNLMKPHIVYALALAVFHVRQGIPALESLVPSPRLGGINDEVAIASLTTLSDALENADEPGEFAEFVDSCASRTNVREQREKRVRWFCRALTEGI